MSDADKQTIGTRAFDLGEWMPAPGVTSRPPHFHEWLDRRDPLNQFGVEWADERRTDPVAVQDIDGCRAMILGPSRDAADRMGRRSG